MVKVRNPITSGRWIRGAGGVAGLLVGLALLTASCGGPGATYIKHTDDSSGLFVKLPEDWAAFETAGPEGATFVRAIDSAREPALDHVNSQAPVEPAGYVLVSRLEQDQRDKVSFAYLRSLALQREADPLEAMKDPSNGIKVYNYSEVTADGGFRGVRFELSRSLDDGSQVASYHISMVDERTSKLYRLVLRCEIECYVKNKDQIDKIAASWTIEER